MHKLIEKLFIQSREQLCEAIFSQYQKNASAVVNYLYFANISGKKLLSAQELSGAQKNTLALQKNNLLADRKTYTKEQIRDRYAQALSKSDFLLPDGIALQAYYWILSGRKLRVPNHNGTDFLPYFLDWLTKKVKNKPENTNKNSSVEICMYGSHPDLLAKAKKHLEKQGYTVVYAQDGYRHFDWKACEASLSSTSSTTIRVLLLGMTTPAIPVQELWAEANRDRIQQYGFLTFGQGGTFDFWAGKQKRAPKLIRTIKLEWLRRLISDPKRNVKKVIDSLSLIGYIFSHLLLKR